MTLPRAATRRHFTEAARIAAAAARKRKREETKTKPLNTPDVFVVRQSITQRQFGWEIRRFGGIVLDRSTGGFATHRAAHAAGLQALSAPLKTP